MKSYQQWGKRTGELLTLRGVSDNCYFCGGIKDLQGIPQSRFGSTLDNMVSLRVCTHRSCTSIVVTGIIFRPLIQIINLSLIQRHIHMLPCDIISLFLLSVFIIVFRSWLLMYVILRLIYFILYLLWFTISIVVYTNIYTLFWYFFLHLLNL